MNLMINIDYHNRLPIYQQIINEVERYVVLGILKPHDQIPSIRDLASTLGINPNTVRKAYSELENKKVIMTISTKGTFINEEVATLTSNKIKECFNDIESSIRTLQKLNVNPKDIEIEINKYLKE